jgi:hypothetical protein
VLSKYFLGAKKLMESSKAVRAQRARYLFSPSPEANCAFIGLRVWCLYISRIELCASILNAASATLFFFSQKRAHAAAHSKELKASALKAERIATGHERK